jgi:hypothetical protein
MNKISHVVACLVGVGIILCLDGLGAGTVTMKTLNNCQPINSYDKIGNYQAASGNEFLVASLEISYAGPDTFSVDPSFFSATVDNIDWKSSPATYDLGKIGLNPLPSVSLRDSSTIKGYIAYEVPVSHNGFKISYTGYDKANIIPQCG